MRTNNSSSRGVFQVAGRLSKMDFNIAINFYDIVIYSLGGIDAGIRAFEISFAVYMSRGKRVFFAHVVSRESLHIDKNIFPPKMALFFSPIPFSFSFFYPFPSLALL